MRRKSDEKKRSILDAALVVFQNKGFERASMSEVAEAANCSKATLYQYYNSKEILFFDAAKLTLNNRDTQIFEVLYKQESIEEALIIFGESYLALMSSPELISIHKMLVVEAERNNLGTLFYSNGREKEYGLMAKYFDEKIQNNMIKEVDTKIAAIHFFALIESEYLGKRILGVIKGLEESQIASAVRRAVSVFISAYGI